MKKHDENKDLRLVSKVANISLTNKTIKANKASGIGIKLLGRIDYLVNHCGWTFIYDNQVQVRANSVVEDNNTNTTTKKEIKKRIRKEQNTEVKTLASKKRK